MDKFKFTYVKFLEGAALQKLCPKIGSFDCFSNLSQCLAQGNNMTTPFLSLMTSLVLH